MLVIPTYNEVQNIAALLEKLASAVPEEPVLFVDDSSPDGTGDLICERRASNPNVQLLQRPAKSGFASAYVDAMKLVLRDNLAPYVITMDADLSHPPESLPQMIGLLQSHPVVIGSRYVTGGGATDWNKSRHSLSAGANVYARLLTRVPVRDLTAGFVGYRADALRNIDLTKIQSGGFAFQMEMKYKLFRAGVPLYEFPIRFGERHAGKSKLSSSIVREGFLFPLKVLAGRI